MSTINFTPFPALSTERLDLRQLKNEDDNEIFIMRSDEEINKYTGIKRAVTIDDARQYIKKINTFIGNNESIMWGVSLKNNSTLIGTICLWNIDAEKKQAEIGYVLHPTYEKQGIMSEAAMAVIDYGFSGMQLNAIVADLEAGNTASIKLLERTGFVYEGQSEIGVVYVISNNNIRQ